MLTRILTMANMAKVAIVAAVGLVGVASLAGCGRTEAPQAPADTAATAPTEDRAEMLRAKEQELEQREAALKMREEEEAARREADTAVAEKPAASKPAAKPASSRSASTSSKPANRSAEATAPAKASPPPMRHVTVPSGTQLTVALASDLSTRTNKPGDAFQARLVSDLVVDGRPAVAAGALVTGTVTDVVSGSNKIGGIPTLGLRFEQLQLNDGRKVAINGELMEQGKSDTGRDTAKILGGAAAGAILGHQVKKNDSGKVIGGILGGAIGAVAAKKTGTEVDLADGSQLTISIGSPIEITTH